MTAFKSFFLLALVLCFLIPDNAEAARRRRRRQRYTGPPPTHPVVLWSRTLSESTDREQRKIAAFKLSSYSQTIYQESIINTLIRCMKDSDVQIKALCAKAMRKAGTKSQTEMVRKALLERYNADPELKTTIARTFAVRKDGAPAVYETLMEAAKKSTDTDELVALMEYFETNGHPSEKTIEFLVQMFHKHENIRVKTGVVKALEERGQGQAAIVDVFALCADHKETPLALTCLAGLQQQGRKNARAWDAVQKTIMSEDADVLMATLDVINALSE